jgi:hypothetical protein
VDFEQALTAELSIIAGLNGQIFPTIAEQDSLVPYLIYSLGKNKETQTLTRYTGLVKSDYQIDLFHSSYAGLKALKKLVIQRLKSFDQRVVGTSGPYIQDVTIINDFETYEYALKLHKGVIEFNVSYNE